MGAWDSLPAGLLFTAIDFDNFGLLLKAALSDLDDLLARDAVVKGPQGHGPDRSDLALQQLAALVIYNPGSIPVPSNPRLESSHIQASIPTLKFRISGSALANQESRLCGIMLPDLHMKLKDRTHISIALIDLPLHGCHKAKRVSM